MFQSPRGMFLEKKKNITMWTVQIYCQTVYCKLEKIRELKWSFKEYKYHDLVISRLEEDRSLQVQSLHATRYSLDMYSSTSSPEHYLSLSPRFCK